MILCYCLTVEFQNRLLQWCTNIVAIRLAMQSRACFIIDSACDCITTRTALKLFLYTGVTLDSYHLEIFFSVSFHKNLPYLKSLQILLASARGLHEQHLEIIGKKNSSVSSISTFEMFRISKLAATKSTSWN